VIFIPLLLLLLSAVRGGARPYQPPPSFCVQRMTMIFGEEIKIKSGVKFIGAFALNFSRLFA
jgi:hypothetical protein